MMDKEHKADITKRYQRVTRNRAMCGAYNIRFTWYWYYGELWLDAELYRSEQDLDYGNCYKTEFEEPSAEFELQAARELLNDYHEYTLGESRRAKVTYDRLKSHAIKLDYLL